MSAQQQQHTRCLHSSYDSLVAASMMPMQLAARLHCDNAAAGTLHVQAAYMTLHHLHAVTATTTSANTIDSSNSSYEAVMVATSVTQYKSVAFTALLICAHQQRAVALYVYHTQLPTDATEMSMHSHTCSQVANTGFVQASRE
eukprot:7237-Heterococcus_DN1.PRE.1